MASPLVEALAAHATLSIVGTGKNAGKTTVLNCLLRLLAADARTAAVTSIGRDGEAVDVVTGTAKPALWVRQGTLLATAADLLRQCDITREILLTTGMHTPLGEVILLRALSDGFVQLAGPSMTGQMTEIIALLQGMGAQTVLIDGAAGRMSLAAPAVSRATILCAGASYGADMDAVVAQAAHICRLLTLPESTGESDRRHVVDGALTDAAAVRLSLQPGDELVAQDSSRILLSAAQLSRLAARGVSLAVLHATTLCCVCVNPSSATGIGFDSAAFQARMAEAVPVPVLNVQELCDDRS